MSDVQRGAAPAGAWMADVTACANGSAVPSGMPSALLEVRGLSLHAGIRPLLRGLDWQVLPGQRWCVIGRNAAGKSTLLRALAGLPVPRRAGQVLWQGRPQADWPAPDAALLRAYAPQHNTDRFAISVGRLLALSTLRLEAAATAELLAALDIDELIDRDLRTLSGGERQRVALAQCAVQGAPLMLMDEPVSFQDPAHQAVVACWMAAHRPVSGAGALVFSAHDVNWVSGTATHVLALLGDGQWRAGPCAALMSADLLQQVYGCAWLNVGGVWRTC